VQKINQKYIDSVVKQALKEDVKPFGDITTKLILTKKCKAKIIAKQNGIIAGLDFFK
jgi:nicotinate-nucleotide pyrophosphorylase